MISIRNRIVVVVFFLKSHICSLSKYLALPTGSFQKQPPEVFCKKRCSYKFRKIQGKHLPQSLFFNKAAGIRPATLLKMRLSATGVFL